MYCVKCRGFKPQSFEMKDNGVPLLIMQCHGCQRVELFEFAAGGWIPQSLVLTMENFVDGRIVKGIEQAAGKSLPLPLSPDEEPPKRRWWKRK